MKSIRYDIFNGIGIVDALCITTNGFVTKKGKCVMGRGTAKQAKNLWSGIDTILANKIEQGGNVVHRLGKTKNTEILSFPVKPSFVIFDGTNAVKHMSRKYSIGDTIPGWAAKAELKIIEKSARELVDLADVNNWNKILVPAPGCGAGELKHNSVFKLLEGIFDDRFRITYL